MIRKIISGAQTGADRGGLEAALELGLARGGWAPRGWRSEDGEIPEVYRAGMRESHASAYSARTAQNVHESDGTMILSFGELPVDSGSMLTVQLARKMQKLCRALRIPIDGELEAFPIRYTLEWILDNRIIVLNVAGPRESREPGIQLAARRALVAMLGANR